MDLLLGALLLLHPVLGATTTRHHVCVVGAGISGLRCASQLAAAGDHMRVTVLEASDGVGGRVRTDELQGFLLDRGFQVFIAAYPEARASLDYKKLQLGEFVPGAIVHLGGNHDAQQQQQQQHLVADISRRPDLLAPTLRFPVGSFMDKARLLLAVAGLKFFTSLDGDIFGRDGSGAGGGADGSALSAEEASALEYLRDSLGLEPPLIDSFFRPFFKGIFLAPLEGISSRLLLFVLKMFADGAVCLPANGLGAVSEQLAEQVRAAGGDVRTSTAVEGIPAPGEVRLSDGSCLTCDAIVVATPRREAVRMLREDLLPADAPLLAEDAARTREELSCACLYFALDHPPPVSEPILVLNGRASGSSSSSAGLVNTVCFPSMVSPTYAPAGSHLASVGVVGADAAGAEDLEGAVRAELGHWFSAEEVAGWKHLRTYRIPNAQESRPPGTNANGFNREPRIAPGVYLCGDHCATPSLNGALRSGRAAAEAILKDLVAAP